MCIILDANKFGDYLNKNDAGLVILRGWVEKKKKAKIAYSPTAKLKKELGKGRMMDHLEVLRAGGVLEQFNKKEVEAAQSNLKNELKIKKIKMKSDDPHIIALAQVSGSNLLVSSDTELCEDFKKIINDGKLYPINKDTNKKADYTH